ncbi:MAG: lytic murein transglycosylase [Hasllibacter sp.]
MRLLLPLLLALAAPAAAETVRPVARPAAQILPASVTAAVARVQPAPAAATAPVDGPILAVAASPRPPMRPQARTTEMLIEAQLASPEDGSQAGLEAWIARFRPRALAAGIDAATFDAAMAQARYDPEIVRRDRNQTEFTKTIWDYLDTAVSEARVANGRAALARHADALARIEGEYGVDRHVVAAIWGLESAYGGFRGNDSTISALATLAYDGRRGDFFEAELIAALRILQSGVIAPADLRGSWAGAMGHTQFMPTSYFASAVDGTGDGRRDIWSDDPVDALASTANYLAERGWTTGQPWGVEVTLPDGFDWLEARRDNPRAPSEWQAMGVRAADGAPIPDHGPATILIPAGHQGAAFMIWDNFEVLETYNTADAYVIGVGHLADRLRGGPPIRASWPRRDRALTGDERREMQRRLEARGFDPGGVDGRIGPLTVGAVRRFQASRGEVPDGYASPAVLEALR